MLKKTLIIILMVALLITGCRDEESVNKDNNTIEDYTPVVVESVKTENVSETVTLPGVIMPKKTLAIMPKTIGIVKEIYVKVGDVVKKDQLIFTLYKDEVSQNAKTAKKTLDEVSANYKMIKERYDAYTEILEKGTKLFKEGKINNEAYKNILSQNPIEQLKIAENALNQTKSAYEKILDVINSCYVTAPITGTVASININEEGYALNTQPSMTMIDINSVIVMLSVTESVLNDLNVGKSVEINLPSADTLLSASISSISPTPDLRTNLYTVNIDIDNSDNMIKPGMTTEVIIEKDNKANALLVNSESILEKNNNKYVYIVENNVAILKEVITGIETEKQTEIISGINPEDKIIIMGQNYIKEDSKIKIVRGN